ncbi:MAG: 4-hydroxy-tetrahydrodipicolinate reductase [Planctomycetes bacterium]|nr:4-hydroxy-tetrahydrodipicolinate reductase [Planctomycetota bacterium]
MKRLIVHGAHGRMGRRICALGADDPRFEIVAEIDRDNASEMDAATCPVCDVVIDFSTPQGTERVVRFAAERGVACLVGTTGLSPENLETVDDAARSTAVMIAPNTSLGVAVMSHLAAEATRLLDDEFDIDLVESHHAGKRDAPSGTALRLVEAIRCAGTEVPADRVHAIRAGDIVGEHSLHFSGAGERIEIMHAATSRDVFARGALRAAAWLVGRPPGRYVIEHALGLA